MNYHRRFSEDGTCEIICTGCFLTLGTANGIIAAKEIEARHVCGVKQRPQMAISPLSGNRLATSRPIAPLHFSKQSSRISAIVQGTPAPFVYLAVGLFIYALPTGAEWIASHHLNPWFATILPGDLTGCVCLAIVFGMRRTGLILYLLLTACEALLYIGHFVPAGALLWIVDLVPTLIVAGTIAQRQRPRAPLHETAAA
jgi:hypothetical protein